MKREDAYNLIDKKVITQNDIHNLVDELCDDHEAEIELKDIALEAQLKEIERIKKKFNIQSDKLRLFTNMYFDLLEDAPDEPRTCESCKFYVKTTQKNHICNLNHDIWHLDRGCEQWEAKQ